MDNFILLMIAIVVCIACPEHCKQCTVNENGGVECSRGKCDAEYGIKEADKTCSSTHADLFEFCLYVHNTEDPQFKPFRTAKYIQ